MPRSTIQRLVVIAALLMITLGCAMLTPVSTARPAADPTAAIQIAPTHEVIVITVPVVMDEEIEDAAATEEALQEIEIPTATAVVEDVGDISIEYVYTSGLVTALYHLYGTILDHFVDVTLTNNGASPVTLVVKTTIEGFTTESIETVDLEAGEAATIHQNPRLTQDAVDRLGSEQPGTFHIQVTQIGGEGEKLLMDETEEILLYSRRDFVWIEGFEIIEEYELLTAWVTPTDPAVEELIRYAADYIDGGQMWTGYGGIENDAEGGVWSRLEALWEAERQVYQLTYISTSVTFGPNSVQRMRLPVEVLEQRGGNCIELVTLYASAVEAMQLETAIVRIPGHAFLAVRTDDVNASYYFVETTMIGQYGFSDAITIGNQEWEEIFPHLDAGEDGYAFVTVQDMRAKGILPIPWK